MESFLIYQFAVVTLGKQRSLSQRKETPNPGFFRTCSLKECLVQKEIPVSVREDLLASTHLDFTAPQLQALDFGECWLPAQAADQLVRRLPGKPTPSEQILRQDSPAPRPKIAENGEEYKKKPKVLTQSSKMGLTGLAENLAGFGRGTKDKAP